MRAILDAGDSAVAEGDRRALVELNARFHRALGDAGRNATAAGLVEQLRTPPVELGYAGKLAHRAGASWAEHRAILDAVIAQEPDAARALLRIHLTNASRAGPVDAGPVGEPQGTG